VITKALPTLLTKGAWFLLLLGLLSCNGQSESPEPVSGPEIRASALQLRAGEGLVYHGETPFSGSSVSHYPNDQLAERIHYLEGKKHGLSQKWFRDGTLSFEANLLDGKRDGAVKTWWKDGKIRSESHYKKGVAHGQQLQWYPSGAQFKEMNLVEGKEEGMQRAWRENGKIYNNYEARNGRIFGLKRANLCFELSNEIITKDS